MLHVTWNNVYKKKKKSIPLLHVCVRFQTSKPGGKCKNCIKCNNNSVINLYAKCSLFPPIFLNTAQEHFQVYNVGEDQRFLELQCDPLSAGKMYVVDVQASVNPQMKNLDGETNWSEWSTSVECTCPNPRTGPYNKKEKWLINMVLLEQHFKKEFHFQFLKISGCESCLDWTWRTSCMLLEHISARGQYHVRQCS